MSKKTALITGSTSGIGLGIATEFAKAGYDIVFNGLEKNGAEIAEGVGKEYNIKTKFIGANLLDPAAVEALVKGAEEFLGSISVLVNNAGVQYVAPVDEFPVDKWNLIIGVNMTASFLTAKAAWGGMKKAGYGRIINLTSAHGLVASPFKSAYVTSKHGVTGLTKVLGLEGAEYGITCNAICPGYVKTPLVEGQIADQAKAHGITPEEVVTQVLLKPQAIKEFVTVQDIGDLALFLASPAGRMMTGASIPIEGGWSAR